MNLVASLIVRNEVDRYLGLCLEHLLEFCDEIRLYDDASTDSTAEVAASFDRTQVLSVERSTFYEHEGQARQRALEWTLQANPTHVLNIDADEFVEDGPSLRKHLETSRNLSWRLCMEEVWQADSEHLHVRTDGSWRPYEVMMLWATAQPFTRIRNVQLACGRTPAGAGSRTVSAGVSVLHFGWACKDDRRARYDRYMVADGGRFHAGSHLESIMWPDDRVRTQACPWPAGLEGIRSALVDRANKTQVPSK
jgi:glycosyl transferase family 2